MGGNEGMCVSDGLCERSCSCKSGIEFQFLEETVHSVHVFGVLHRVNEESSLQVRVLE